MSIAHEFWNEGSFVSADLEEKIGFFLEHYHLIMKVHRAVKEAEESRNKRQQYAHRKLESLRDYERKMSKLWPTMGEEKTKEDRKKVQADKEYYTNLRNKDEPIYFNGQPLEINQVSHFVLNNRKLLYAIEKVDLGARGKLGPASKIVLCKGLWPLRKALVATAKVSSGKTRSTLKSSLQFVSSIPEAIKKHIVLE